METGKKTEIETETAPPLFSVSVSNLCLLLSCIFFAIYGMGKICFFARHTKAENFSCARLSPKRGGTLVKGTDLCLLYCSLWSYSLP